MTLITEGISVCGQIDDPTLFLTDTTSGAATNFMADNQSELVVVEIDFRYEVYRIAMATNQDSPELLPPIVLGPDQNEVNRVLDNRAIWTSNIGTSWEGFNVGDSILVAGDTDPFNNKTANIIEILLDDSGTHTLITDTTFNRNIMQAGATITNTTPQTYIEYSFGLIGNDEADNFISKTDGSTQIVEVKNIDNGDFGYKLATPKGNKSWYLDSEAIRVRGNGVGLSNVPNSQAFRIRHKIPISPFMLSSEFADIQAGIPPDRFEDIACLKYVFQIKTRPTIDNPNDETIVVTGTFDGNTGWFNENFNGGVTNYSVDNLVYKQLDDTINPALQVTTNETKIQFDLYNTTDTPFEYGSTNLIFGFNYAPADQALYRDIPASTSQTMEHNFMFDNVVSTVGGANLPPYSSGTSELKIKSITSTFVNSSHVEVEVRMELSENLVTRIAANIAQQYMIFITCKDHTLTRDDSDKVTLLLDAGTFFLDLSDPDMILSDQLYMQHPDSDVDTDGTAEINGRIEDDILCINNWSLDRNDRETDEVSISRIVSQIIVRKNTGASFVVDQEVSDVSGSQLVNDPTYGDIANVSIEKSRGFKTPADSNRANVKSFRRFDEDAAGFFEYRTQFPIILRWEEFIPYVKPPGALGNVSSEFFDPSEPNNGQNQDWIKYDELADWDIFYRSNITALKNGDPLTYIADSRINTFDYLLGTEWDTENITSFDETGALLDDGGSSFIIHYADGKLRAEFTYIGPAPNPLLSEITIVMKLDVFEKGTYKNTYWLSSAYDAHVDTWWRSIDTSNRVVVTNPSGSIFRGEALVQGALLPEEISFKCTARIYDNRDEVPPVPPNGKLLSPSGDFKLMSGSTGFKQLST